MSKFQDFLNNLKSKFKNISPVQLIGAIIIIALVVWYIVSLFFDPNGPNKKKVVGPLCNITGTDPTTRCEVGQLCQTQCNPPQCSERGGIGQKYYCELKKWDQDCGSDKYPYLNSSCGLTNSKDVRCISKPKTDLTSTKGKEYQSLIQSGEECIWLSGFDENNCKLTDKNDNTGILDSKCINNLPDGSPYSFKQDIIDNSFQCGYPQGKETKNPKQFSVQGADGILKEDPSAILNIDIFNECSNPRDSKSSFANITDWDMIGKNSNGKINNKNTLCGIHTSNGAIDGYMQQVDCSRGGTIQDKSWQNYYTSLNCDSNGNDLDINRKCEVPCWMFKSQKAGAVGQGSSCDGTSSCDISGGFPLACKWTADDCSGYDYSPTNFEQSCNYDLNGCTTKLKDDQKTVLVPTYDGNGNCTYTDNTSTPVDASKKGCRPVGESYIWKGLFCSRSPTIYNYITKTIPNFSQQSINIGIDKITFTISNPTPGIKNQGYNDLITSLFYISKAGSFAPPLTLTSLVYVVKDNKIDPSNQVYITILTEKYILTFLSTINIPGDILDNVELQLTLPGDDKIINFPFTSDYDNFVVFRNVPTGSELFMGLSLQFPTKGITLNSFEFSTNNLNTTDLTNSLNIFIK